MDGVSFEDDMLAAAAARYMERGFDFDRRARCISDPTGEGAQVWRELAELGMLGLRAPEADGGVDASAAQIVAAMEAFGRGLLTAPLTPGALVCMEILRGADTPAGNDLIGRIVAGEARAALAYLEPGRRFNDVPEGAALSGGDGPLRLSGRKTAAWGAACATDLIVSARDAEGRPALVLVPPSASGVEMRGYATYDGGDAAEVVMDGVEIARENLLAEGGRAQTLLRRGLDLGTLAVSAEAVGAMARALEITQEHITTRRQFGRPLSANQALAHRFAEAWCETELARALVTRAARAFDADPEGEGRRLASAAKCFAAEAGRLVGQECVQMHGAMGVTAEAPISHYYKRLTAIDSVYGNASLHADRFARSA